MAMTKEENRRAFEAWYQADIVNWSMRFHRDSDNKNASYSFSGTEKAWKAWQAGQAWMQEFNDRSNK